MGRVCLLAVFVTLTATLAIAQATSSVSGSAIDSAGGPISGAAVVVKYDS